jgi:hypothetical protein
MVGKDCTDPGDLTVTQELPTPSKMLLWFSWETAGVLVAVFCLNWNATSCSGSFCWLLQGKFKMTLHTLVL